MNITGKKEKRQPWSFIPTQYFAEGVPFVIVNNLSVIMYKSLGVANDLIGYTSFLYLPWSLKFLWAPFVDSAASKRSWVVWMQFLLAICFATTALGIQLNSFFTFTLIIFTITAFVSATHDIVTDGFYLHALNKGDQAFFTGIRSTFYRFAMIFAGGILVTFAGSLSMGSNMKHGWSLALLAASALFAIFWLYHKFILPYPSSDVPVSPGGSLTSFREVFREYFTQSRIGIILTYILLYRFGEGLLLKMAAPFLLDSPDKGGLGIGVAQVGIMYGTVGIIALIIGGILGGWMIKKYGLKRLIWIMALAMNLPNLLYVYLSITKPISNIQLDLSFISGKFGGGAWLFEINPIAQLCIFVEQFGYGFGFTAFIVYLLYISKGQYKTSHYAISTGLMAIGMMVPGFISGWFQVHYGYQTLFWTSFLTTIPGMAVIPFLPVEKDNNS
ncbi:MAG: transporter, family, beta-lactamase induction signal transducer AmpG [Bacteroidota bacterium]|nr:transporter, family, beta-lactamase induction signal transducer AmpG [Bacteroidota bacterium]